MSAAKNDEIDRISRLMKEDYIKINKMKITAKIRTTKMDRLCEGCKDIIKEGNQHIRMHEEKGLETWNYSCHPLEECISKIIACSGEHKKVRDIATRALKRVVRIKRPKELREKKPRKEKEKYFIPKILKRGEAYGMFISKTILDHAGIGQMALLEVEDGRVTIYKPGKDEAYELFEKGKKLRKLVIK